MPETVWSSSEALGLKTSARWRLTFDGMWLFDPTGGQQQSKWHAPELQQGSGRASPSTTPTGTKVQSVPIPSGCSVLDGGAGETERKRERKTTGKLLSQPSGSELQLLLSCITYLPVAHWELLISCYWEQMTDLRLAQSADMIIILSSASKKGGFRMHLPCTTLSSARPQARWSGWGAVAANKSWYLKARDFC